MTSALDGMRVVRNVYSSGGQLVGKGKRKRLETCELSFLGTLPYEN